MKLVVLSRSAAIPSTHRLVHEAGARGHAVRVLSPLRIELLLRTQGAQLFYRQRRLRVPEVVIPRVAASLSTFALPIVDQYAVMGARVMNEARGIALSRSTFRCLQQLAANGLAIPATALARDAADLASLVERVGGVPVLVKVAQGGERRGIMVCESLQSLKAAVDALVGLGHSLILQEYVHKRSRDVRVFVIGGRAVAAAVRHARPGRLTKALSHIARHERADLSDAARLVAERASSVIGLEICAVDLLDVPGSTPRVFEVNASPSIPELEAATGVNLAAAIVARAEVLGSERKTG